MADSAHHPPPPSNKSLSIGEICYNYNIVFNSLSRSCLNFFLCNENILDVIDRVFYENTITDFDHKRVTLTLF